MTLSIISHPDCALHEMGLHHPENPSRLSTIKDQLPPGTKDSNFQYHDAPSASHEQLCRVHDPEYIEYIFQKAPNEGQVWLDLDTSMNPHSLSAALHAAGAMVLGADLVMAGQTNAVFCNVRPPGHHAEHNKAMVFCIFNNIAVGAAHALQAYRLKRVAIVDFDVHHGNGTEDIFREVPRILFCSTFQHPLYPETGTEAVPEHIINVPLAARTNCQVFRAAVEAHWLPKLEAFQPELILISVGFDAHVEDDMVNLCLVDEDFSWVTQKIKTIADKYANGRIVSSLEGGYALPALGRSVTAHINALLG